MPVTSTRSSTVQHRAALWAVRLVFAFTGLLFATWAARIPTIQAQLDLTVGELGLVLAGLNLGAVLGLRLGGLVAPRFGSRITLRIAMPLFACTLSGIALADGLAGLTVGVAVFAVANSVVDVAMNAHGVAVERAIGRALLSGIHACHSLGAIAGALLGALAELADVPVPAHFVIVSMAVAAAATASNRALLPSQADAVPSSARDGSERLAAGWPARVILLGLLAFCVALAEGAANDWAAVYLNQETGTSTTVAALGFGVFAAAMFSGRLLGDRLIDRFGLMKPFLAGTLIAGIGFGLALLVGTAAAGLVGLVLLGLGLSCTLPITLTAGGAVVGLHSSRAIANVSTLGYLGFFSGPVVIGLVAEHAGLTVGMAIPAVVILLAACGAPILRPEQQHTENP